MSEQPTAVPGAVPPQPGLAGAPTLDTGRADGPGSDTVPADLLPDTIPADPLLRALWTSPGVAIAVWDEDGHYLAVNEVLAAANHAPAGQHLGRTVVDQLGEQVGGGMLNRIRQVLESGRAVVGVEYLDRDRVWETSWLPMHSPDGRRAEVACIAFDVTQARMPSGIADLPLSRSAVWNSRLLAVAQALSGAGEAQEVLDRAFAELREAVGATSALIAVSEHNEILFHTAAAHRHARSIGLDEAGGWPHALAPDDVRSFTAQAAQTCEPVWLPSPEVLEERFPAAWSMLRLTSEKAWAALPVTLDDQLLGVLRLAWDEPQEFTVQQQAFLRDVAAQTAHTLHRATLLAAERYARGEAERAQVRLGALLRVSLQLAAARTSSDVARVVLDEGFAAIGACGGGVGYVDEEQELLRVLGTRGGPSWVTVPLDADIPFVRAARTGTSSRSTLDDVRDADPAAADWMEGLGSQLALSIPLVEGARVVGSLSIHLPTADASQLDEHYLRTLAAMTGQALARARAEEQAQQAVAQLVEALLPRTLDQAPGVTTSVGYRAASRAPEVGGDFYDAVTLPNGALTVVIGDVEGHDLRAAALMAQLRSVIRAAAMDGEAPGQVLARADSFLVDLDTERLATAVVVELHPHAEVAIISSAGHLPPLQTTADSTTVIDVPQDPPLGLDAGVRTETTIDLPPGSRLLLLTDGLLERRGGDLETSLNSLAGMLDDLVDSPPEETVRTLLEAALADTGDDAALLVVKTEAGHRSPPTRAVRLLPPRPQSGALARGWAQRLLHRWEVPQETADEALLVATELITNAGRFATQPIAVSLERTEDLLLLSVTDDSDRSPRLQQAAADDVDGRGLSIVDAMAASWGVTPHEQGGKTVWAHLDVRRASGPEGAPSAQ